MKLPSKHKKFFLIAYPLSIQFNWLGFIMKVGLGSKGLIDIQASDFQTF